MKTILSAVALSTMAVLASTSPSTALARSPMHVEPGPVQSIDEQGIQAVDALMMADSAKFKKFVKSGNQVKDVSVQYLNPETTVFRYTRQQCMHGGVAGGTCLGGTTLVVTIKETRQGSHVKIDATTDLLTLR